MSEHPYDELPGLLFGELNRAEVTVVSDHLAGCDDCRRELAVLAATSASLRATARQAQAVDGPERAVPDPARLPHRGAEPGTGSLEAAPAAATPDAGRAGRRRRGPLIGLAAALALAVVAAVVLWTGPLRPDRSGGTVPLAGVGAVAASGQASMVGDGGDRQMTVTADDLPALRPGQYYEVWLLDPDAGTVFPVGVLPPDGEARFTIPASVVGRYQAIDVSLEADDNDPAHSKRSLLRGRYA
ncbi:MAG TPA: anti-sigma factor [Actinomycetota bacterium]|nr:anti-sigma factor [Actinomycetota bacterium]